MNDIEIVNQQLKSESFSGRSVTKFIAVHTKFIDCFFQNMNIKNICFGGGSKQSHYVNCNFDGSTFSSNVPGVARFESCSFKNIKINDFFCTDVEFIDCVFSGEIERGNFVGMRREIDGELRTNEFKNNDFSDLILNDVGFTNIDLSLQKFPKSDSLSVITDVSLFISNVKADIDNITDHEMYNDVLKVLSILEIESEGGNNQLLLDKLSFPKNLQEAINLMLSD